MALLGRTSGHRNAGVELILALTGFGTLRLAARALADTSGVRSLRLRWTALLLAGLTGFVAWRSIHPFETNVALSFDIPATILTVVAAILTADYLSGKRPTEHPLRFDWIGVTALSVGLGTALLLRANNAEPWWPTWIFPAYAASFAICLTLRKLAVLQKLED